MTNFSETTNSTTLTIHMEMSLCAVTQGVNIVFGGKTLGIEVKGFTDLGKVR